MPKINDKQERFIQEYLIDLNAAKAAERAGYSPKSAARIGAKLVNKSHIREAIEAAKGTRAQRLEITQDYVLSNLREVVERTMQRAPVCNGKGEQIQDGQGRNVWQFDAKGASKALELLGKHLGILQGHSADKPGKRAEIIRRLKDGEISLRDAAYEFELNGLQLPDTIRILLAKEQPEPEDVSKGMYRVVSDEEIEARINIRDRQYVQELDGLDERRRQIMELRENVKDNFAGNISQSGAREGGNA